MEWSKMFLNENQPTLEQVSKYINSPLWDKLNISLKEYYGASPKLEYSTCSMQKGWNVKYYKKSKNLCTIYPMSGFFIALVVISGKKQTEAEFMINSCSEPIKVLFNNTKLFNGCRWLMVEVNNESIFNDTMKLIGLRAE